VRGGRGLVPMMKYRPLVGIVSPDLRAVVAG
jgi:hypothetical protein